MGMSRNEMRYEWWTTHMFTDTIKVARVLASCTNQKEVNDAIDAELFKIHGSLPVEAEYQAQVDAAIDSSMNVRQLPSIRIDNDVMDKIDAAAKHCGIIPKAMVRAILSDWAYHRN